VPFDKVPQVTVLQLSIVVNGAMSVNFAQFKSISIGGSERLKSILAKINSRLMPVRAPLQRRGFFSSTALRRLRSELGSGCKDPRAL
jgi:hypothetical protein